MVFGETTLDVIAEVDELPFPEGPAAKVERAPQPTVGGRAANVATFAAAFGLDVVLLSGCGSEYLDQYRKLTLEKRFREEYVYISKHDPATATATIFRKLDHAVTFFEPGMLAATSELKKYRSHVRKVTEKVRPKLVCCTSERHDMVAELFTKHYSATSIWKAYSPGPEVVDASPSVLKSILEQSDFLFLNEAESKNVQTRLGNSIGRIVKDCNIKAAVITLGEFGALLVQPKKEKGDRKKVMNEFVPNYPVPDSAYKNASGAGDALAGAFLGKLLGSRKAGYKTCLQWAVACSSLVVEQQGCIVPDLTYEMIAKRVKMYEETT